MFAPSQSPARAQVGISFVVDNCGKLVYEQGDADFVLKTPGNKYQASGEAASGAAAAGAAAAGAPLGWQGRTDRWTEGGTGAQTLERIMYTPCTRAAPRHTAGRPIAGSGGEDMERDPAHARIRGPRARGRAARARARLLRRLSA